METTLPIARQIEAVWFNLADGVLQPHRRAHSANAEASTEES